MTLGIVYFVVAILVVVMIHETGHFLVAKLFGFKATKFFLGFGPTVWSTTKGETEYGVKAIPAGGFVKIIGMNPYEEVPPEDRPRSYPNKPKWQRALLLVAGSATHWVVAFVILFVTLMTIGLPTGDVSTEIAQVQTTMIDAGREETESPASAAGLRPGDQITGVGGTEVSSWADVRSYIREHAGERATFDVERDGTTVTVAATLGRAIFDSDGELVDYAAPGEALRPLRDGETSAGFLGVVPQPTYAALGVGSSLTESTEIVWATTARSITSLDDVFRPVFNGELLEALGGEGERDPEGAVGLVGAGRIAGESVARGEYLAFVELIVVFTIFVGIMNLLPLPPLDGGHLAVLAYEAVTGRTADVRKLIPIAAAVISFFVLLFIAILYLDLARPIKLPF